MTDWSPEIMILYKIWKDVVLGDEYYFEWKNRRTASLYSAECFIMKHGAKSRELIGNWQLIGKLLFLGDHLYTFNYIAELAPKEYKMKWTAKNGEELFFTSEKERTL